METGAVFTFGRSRFADNIPSRFWVRNDPILQLACGDQHTALVTESGRIFMFGPNDWGQLGLGHSRHVDKPSCIKALKHEKVSLVACGGCHTLIATDSGKIYSFGANGEGQLGAVGVEKSMEPYHIKKLPSCIRYKALAAGFEHSVCLTESGDVYIWGSNSEGQLGFGDLTESYVPTRLLAEETMKSVAVGYYHTALLTENGSVYIFGETEGGKLGLGDEIKKCRTPVRLVSFDTTVESISCGSSYTALITKQNELYTFGTGSNGELGHGTSQQMLSTPKKVCLPFKVKAVSCGANHTAITTEDGYLYTFGDSRHGKLAQGEDSYSNLFEPCLVDQFESYVIDKVVCGGCHTMVVAHQKPSHPENTNSSAKTFKVLPPAILSSSTDFSATLSARDRRRQTAESTNSSLNRTLPSLSGKVQPGSLFASSALENVLCPPSEENHIPQLDRTLPNGKCLMGNLEESEEKVENYSEKVEDDITESPMRNPSKTLAPKPAPRKLKPKEIVAQKENDSVKELLPDVVSLNSTEEILEKEFTINKQDLPTEHSQKVPLSNGVTLDRIENEEYQKDAPIPMKLEINLQSKNKEEPKYLNSKESIEEKGKKEDSEDEIQEISCSEEESVNGEDGYERKRQKNKNGVEGDKNGVEEDKKDSSVKKKKKDKKQKGKKRNKGVEVNEKRDLEDEKFTEGQQEEEEEEEKEVQKENEEDLEKNNKNKQKSKKGILNIFGKKKVISNVEDESKEGKNVEKESEEKKESPRKKKESKKKEIKSDEEKEKGEEKVKGKSGKKQNHPKPDSVEEEEEEVEEEEEKEKEKDGEKEDAKDEKSEEDKKKETEKSETILENDEKDKNSRTCLIL
ncbi:X-linked retinitis pigmentosa GTPase regulator isoform X2 [Octopus bimaculoides]|uniref:X-linked retinitis pigmentosa GTPase regulator isoform X2 n=1 Tax=Octopus bimaculoides TaxID=37653 RepID=UPI0022E15ECF|nr:X-linked retinitis pigmentosa GTPase regulator isoform X2 [Octopus bimaculoides]